MGKITFNGKDITSPFTFNGKKVVKITMGGKVLSLKTVNSFTGRFLDKVKEAEFMSSITVVRPYAFKDQPYLTGIRMEEVTAVAPGGFEGAPLTSIELPKVEHIYGNAFVRAKVTSLDLPEVTAIEVAAFLFCEELTSLNAPKLKTIDNNAFEHSKLTTLDLPAAENIGTASFARSPLTSISIPNAEGVDPNAFVSVVNAPTTTVTMKAKFNNDDDKNLIFGGHGDQITFNWVP